MSEEKIKILEMLSSGKITVEEASKLIDASDSKLTNLSGLKFFYVSIEPKETEAGKKIGKVFVKVPFALIKAGFNIAGLIPKEAQEQINNGLKNQGMSFDFSDLKPENIDDLMASLELLTVEVDNADSLIKVFCK
ncbi:MAG: SHOCT-like domain-containing protein [Pleomorphochaeta sp.]